METDVDTQIVEERKSTSLELVEFADSTVTKILEQSQKHILLSSESTSSDYHDGGKCEEQDSTEEHQVLETHKEKVQKDAEKDITGEEKKFQLVLEFEEMTEVDVDYEQIINEDDDKTLTKPSEKLVNGTATLHHKTKTDIGDENDIDKLGSTEEKTTDEVTVDVNIEDKPLDMKQENETERDVSEVPRSILRKSSGDATDLGSQRIEKVHKQFDTQTQTKKPFSYADAVKGKKSVTNAKQQVYYHQNGTPHETEMNLQKSPLEESKITPVSIAGQKGIPDVTNGVPKKFSYADAVKSSAKKPPSPGQTSPQAQQPDQSNKKVTFLTPDPVEKVTTGMDQSIYVDAEQGEVSSGQNEENVIPTTKEITLGDAMELSIYEDAKEEIDVDKETFNQRDVKMEPSIYADALENTTTPGICLSETPDFDKSSVGDSEIDYSIQATFDDESVTDRLAAIEDIDIEDYAGSDAANYESEEEMDSFIQSADQTGAKFAETSFIENVDEQAITTETWEDGKETSTDIASPARTAEKPEKDDGSADDNTTETEVTSKDETVVEDAITKEEPQEIEIDKLRTTKKAETVATEYDTNVDEDVHITGTEVHEISEVKETDIAEQTLPDTTADLTEESVVGDKQLVSQKDDAEVLGVKAIEKKVPEVPEVIEYEQTVAKETPSPTEDVTEVGEVHDRISDTESTEQSGQYFESSEMELTDYMPSDETGVKEVVCDIPDDVVTVADDGTESPETHPAEAKGETTDKTKEYRVEIKETSAGADGTSDMEQQAASLDMYYVQSVKSSEETDHEKQYGDETTVKITLGPKDALDEAIKYIENIGAEISSLILKDELSESVDDLEAISAEYVPQVSQAEPKHFESTTEHELQITETPLDNETLIIEAVSIEKQHRTTDEAAEVEQPEESPWTVEEVVRQTVEEAVTTEPCLVEYASEVIKETKTDVEQISADEYKTEKINQSTAEMEEQLTDVKITETTLDAETLVMDTEPMPQEAKEVVDGTEDKPTCDETVVAAAEMESTESTPTQPFDELTIDATENVTDTKEITEPQIPDITQSEAELTASDLLITTQITSEKREGEEKETDLEDLEISEECQHSEEIVMRTDVLGLETQGVVDEKITETTIESIEVHEMKSVSFDDVVVEVSSAEIDDMASAGYKTFNECTEPGVTETEVSEVTESINSNNTVTRIVQVHSSKTLEVEVTGGTLDSETLMWKTGFQMHDMEGSTTEKAEGDISMERKEQEYSTAEASEEEKLNGPGILPEAAETTNTFESDVTMQDVEVETEMVKQETKSMRQQVAEEETVTVEEITVETEPVTQEVTEETEAVSNQLPAETEAVTTEVTKEIEPVSLEPVNVEVSEETEMVIQEFTIETEALPQVVYTETEAATLEVTKETEAVTQEISEETKAVLQEVTEETGVVTQEISEETEAVSQEVTEETVPVTQVISEETEVVTHDVTEETDAVTQEVSQETEVVTREISEENVVVTQEITEETEAVAYEVIEESEVLSQNVSETEAVTKEVTKETEAVLQKVPETEAVTLKFTEEPEALLKDAVTHEITQETQAVFQEVTQETEALTQETNEDTEAVTQEVIEETAPVTQEAMQETDAVTQEATEETEAATQEVTEETKAATPGITQEIEAVTQGVTDETEAVTQEVTQETEAQYVTVETEVVETEAETQEVTEETKAVTQVVTEETEAVTQEITVETGTVTQEVTEENVPLAQEVTGEIEVVTEEVTQEKEAVTQEFAKETKALISEITEEVVAVTQKATQEKEALIPEVTEETETKTREATEETFTQEVTGEIEAATQEYIQETEAVIQKFTEGSEAVAQKVAVENETVSHEITGTEKSVIKELTAETGALGQQVTEETEPVTLEITQETKTVAQEVTEKTEAALQVVTEEAEAVSQEVSTEAESDKLEVTGETVSIIKEITPGNQTQEVSAETNLGTLHLTTEADILTQEVTKHIETETEEVIQETEVVSKVVTQETESMTQEVTQEIEAVTQEVTEEIEVVTPENTEETEDVMQEVTYKTEAETRMVIEETDALTQEATGKIEAVAQDVTQEIEAENQDVIQEAEAVSQEVSEQAEAVTQGNIEETKAVREDVKETEAITLEETETVTQHEAAEKDMFETTFDSESSTAEAKDTVGITDVIERVEVKEQENTQLAHFIEPAQYFNEYVTEKDLVIKETENEEERIEVMEFTKDQAIGHISMYPGETENKETIELSEDAKISEGLETTEITKTKQKFIETIQFKPVEGEVHSPEEEYTSIVPQADIEQPAESAEKVEVAESRDAIKTQETYEDTIRVHQDVHSLEDSHTSMTSEVGTKQTTEFVEDVKIDETLESPMITKTQETYEETTLITSAPDIKEEADMSWSQQVGETEQRYGLAEVEVVQTSDLAIMEAKDTYEETTRVQQTEGEEVQSTEEEYISVSSEVQSPEEEYISVSSKVRTEQTTELAEEEQFSESTEIIKTQETYDVTTLVKSSEDVEPQEEGYLSMAPQSETGPCTEYAEQAQGQDSDATDIVQTEEQLVETTHTRPDEDHAKEPREGEYAFVPEVTETEQRTESATELRISEVPEHEEMEKELAEQDVLDITDYLIEPLKYKTTNVEQGADEVVPEIYTIEYDIKVHTEEEKSRFVDAMDDIVDADKPDMTKTAEDVSRLKQETAEAEGVEITTSEQKTEIESIDHVESEDKTIETPEITEIAMKHDRKDIETTVLSKEYDYESYVSVDAKAAQDDVVKRDVSKTEVEYETTEMVTNKEDMVITETVTKTEETVYVTENEILEVEVRDEEVKMKDAYGDVGTREISPEVWFTVPESSEHERVTETIPETTQIESSVESATVDSTIDATENIPEQESQAPYEIGTGTFTHETTVETRYEAETRGFTRETTVESVPEKEDAAEELMKAGDYEDILAQELDTCLGDSDASKAPTGEEYGFEFVSSVTDKTSAEEKEADKEGWHQDIPFVDPSMTQESYADIISFKTTELSFVEESHESIRDDEKPIDEKSATESGVDITSTNIYTENVEFTDTTIKELPESTEIRILHQTYYVHDEDRLDSLAQVDQSKILLESRENVIMETSTYGFSRLEQEPDFEIVEEYPVEKEVTDDTEMHLLPLEKLNTEVTAASPEDVLDFDTIVQPLDDKKTATEDQRYEIIVRGDVEEEFEYRTLNKEPEGDQAVVIHETEVQGNSNINFEQLSSDDRENVQIESLELETADYSASIPMDAFKQKHSYVCYEKNVDTSLPPDVATEETPSADVCGSLTNGWKTDMSPTKDEEKQRISHLEYLETTYYHLPDKDVTEYSEATMDNTAVPSNKTDLPEVSEPSLSKELTDVSVIPRDGAYSTETTETHRERTTETTVTETSYYSTQFESSKHEEFQDVPYPSQRHVDHVKSMYTSEEGTPVDEETALQDLVSIIVSGKGDLIEVPVISSEQSLQPKDRVSPGDIWLKQTQLETQQFSPKTDLPDIFTSTENEQTRGNVDIVYNDYTSSNVDTQNFDNLTSPVDYDQNVTNLGQVNNGFTETRFDDDTKIQPYINTQFRDPDYTNKTHPYDSDPLFQYENAAFSPTQQDVPIVAYSAAQPDKDARLLHYSIIGESEDFTVIGKSPKELTPETGVDGSQLPTTELMLSPVTLQQDLPEITQSREAAPIEAAVEVREDVDHGGARPRQPQSQSSPLGTRDTLDSHGARDTLESRDLPREESKPLVRQDSTKSPKKKRRLFRRKSKSKDESSRESTPPTQDESQLAPGSPGDKKKKKRRCTIL